MVAALGSMWTGRGRGGRVTEDTICGWMGRLTSGVEIALEIVNSSLGKVVVGLVARVGETSAEDVGQLTRDKAPVSNGSAYTEREPQRYSIRATSSQAT